MTTRVLAGVTAIPLFAVGLLIGLAVHERIAAAFMVSALSVLCLITTSWALWERQRRQQRQRYLERVASRLGDGSARRLRSVENEP